MSKLMSAFAAIIVATMILVACGAPNPASANPGPGTSVPTPKAGTFLEGDILFRGYVKDSGGTRVQDVTWSYGEYSAGRAKIQMQKGQELVTEEIQKDFIVMTPTKLCSTPNEKDCITNAEDLSLLERDLYYTPQ